MTVHVMKNAVEEALARVFLMSQPALPGDAAMAERRKAAFATFEKLGLPGRRNEDWHYTDLRNLLNLPSVQAYAPIGDLPRREALGMTRRIGSFDEASFAREAANLPAGVRIYTFAQALAERPDLIKRLGEVVKDEDSAMVALTSALFADALFIVVEKGAKIDRPLFASFGLCSDLPMLLVTRGLMLVEAGAEVTVVHEINSGDAPYQAFSTLEVIVEDGARLDYIRHNGSGHRSQNVLTIAARLGKGSTFNVTNVNTGCALVRDELRVTFAGANAKVGLRGASLLRDTQHADVTLMVDHQAPGGESRELFRHVIDDQATGVFQGKIMVKQAAQKTDGQMASNAILLSDDATMNNKPELEIFADDVVCAHGATCGALDEDLLFYLQARGLSEKEAQALMLQAFCGEVFEFIDNEEVRDALNGVVARWLEARAA